MDPLGARQPTCTISELALWGDTEPPSLPVYKESGSPSHSVSPFSVREDLNKKVAIWAGDIAMLQVEAVVNPTNESLSDKNPVSLRLYEVAGPELRDECKTQVGSCRTGEARITGGYRLPARHVIHTVGPRFNVRYKTAAESALYNCYRSVMQIVKGRHLASVAFSVHNSSRRGYPGDEGAHIAIRTIRRFMEHYGDNIDLVVFVTDGVEAWYGTIMPLYFPRNKKEEEFAARALPLELGDEFGEPIIVERQIRISDNPVIKDNSVEENDEEEDEDENGDLLISTVGAHPFSSMTGDQDKERQQYVGKAKPPTEEETQAKIYQEYLRRARTENFQDLASLGAFYKAGLDYLGRQIVVFVGRHLNVSRVDMSKAMAYFIHVMESVVSKDYIFVYFHTQTASENLPDSSFVKQLYGIVDSRYKENLRAFYVVHPSWWLKISGWWFLTFTGSEIKERVHYLTGVQYLYDTINPDQIDVPQFVLDHDKAANGTNYYVPASRGDEASGGL